MEGAPREHAQPSRWELREEGEKGRGRERKWGGREGLLGKCFTGGRAGVPKWKASRVSLMYLMSLGQNGLLVAGASQPYHTAAPGQPGGVLTAYLQGRWGSRKLGSFKFTIHNLMMYFHFPNRWQKNRYSKLHLICNFSVPLGLAVIATQVTFTKVKWVLLSMTFLLHSQVLFRSFSDMFILILLSCSFIMTPMYFLIFLNTVIEPLRLLCYLTSRDF